MKFLKDSDEKKFLSDKPYRRPFVKRFNLQLEIDLACDADSNLIEKLVEGEMSSECNMTGVPAFPPHNTTIIIRITLPIVSRFLDMGFVINFLRVFIIRFFSIFSPCLIKYGEFHQSSWNLILIPCEASRVMKMHRSL